MATIRAAEHFIQPGTEVVLFVSADQLNLYSTIMTAIFSSINTDSHAIYYINTTNAHWSTVTWKEIDVIFVMWIGEKKTCRPLKEKKSAQPSLASCAAPAVLIVMLFIVWIT